jgi:hypothetical protein
MTVAEAARACELIPRYAGRVALRTILVLALTALIAAGCGGDDDDDGGESGTTPSTVQTETTPGGADTTSDDEDSANDEGSSSPDDEGDDPEGGDGSLTRAAFIRRADALCAEVRPVLAEKGQEIAALARRAQTGKLKPDEYFEKSAKLIEDSAQAADGAVSQLEDLPRPKARRGTLERYLTATRNQVDYLLEQSEATRDGDQQEIARLNAVSNRTSQRVRDAATAYGFKVCGGGS